MPFNFWKSPASDERFDREREGMVQTQLARRGIGDDAVLRAFHAVPRHRFVEGEKPSYAYGDHPIPIPCGQTMSQPYVVAYMLQKLRLQHTDSALEIGTGSGYQTAVLAEIAFRVYSIETVETLAKCARTLLDELGYQTIYVRTGDGHEGWPELAPFDAVIVTAAAERVPPALVAQLGTGGRLVIPVGRVYESQTLVRAVKNDDGTLARENVLPVAFVPMVSKGEGPR